MRKSKFRKGFVVAIIVLFVGASITPSISGDIGKNREEIIKITYVDENTYDVIACEGSSGDQVDQKNLHYGNEWICFGGPFGFAQEFKPTLKTCTRVKLMLENRGNPNTNLIVSIRNSLNGNDLTSVSIKSNKIPVGPPGWVDFNFPDIIVTPGLTYYIVCSFFSNIDISVSGWNNYRRGRSWRKLDDNNEWNLNHFMVDYHFITFGTNDPPGPDPFYFVHITDTHVGTTGAKERFIEMVDEINNLNPQPEFVVISGDIVHWGGGEVGRSYYRSFINCVLNFDMPIIICPGNHDHMGNFANYKYYFGSTVDYVTPFHDLRIISMDSGDNEDWWEGGYYGEIDFLPEGTGLENSQYQWLKNRLSEDPDSNKILFMHHPVVCCSQYYNFDEDCWNGCIYKNRENVKNCLRDPDNDGNYDDSVKLVLSGHTHTTFQYKVSPSNGVFAFDILFGEYVSTDQIPDGYLPLYIITDAAGEDMGYRIIEVIGDEIRVYWNSHFQSTVKYECDWIPWFEKERGFEGNEGDVGPAGRLHVYDSSGNHVGINETGGIDFEIPGAYYQDNFIYNETGDYNITGGEVTSVKMGRQDYEYVFETEENSTLNIYGKYIFENDSWIDLTYQNITALNGSIGKLYTNNRDNFTLFWDDDGDGVVDREIGPSNITTTPPYTPFIPSGPIPGKTGFEYTYTTSTTDLNGDQIYYMWDWGDGTNSSWLGPYDSGVNCIASHTWIEKGTYEIKVKAKDIYGCESPWSEPIVVHIIDENELRTTLIIGRISDLQSGDNGDKLEMFYAERLLWLSFNPLDFGFYHSGEAIVTSNDYNGIIKSISIFGRFYRVLIFGRFNAVILSDTYSSVFHPVRDRFKRYISPDPQ